MATRNLARTAIEGGRCGHYKSEVRTHKRIERAALRAYLRRGDFLGEAAPVREPVDACFSDKLSPVRRYLRSRRGRSWNAVRSELFTRFDTRTTPGRHVLFDHVLREVEEDRRWRPRFRVEEGILVAYTYERRQARSARVDLRAVASWLAGRRVKRDGDRFVWVAPGGRRPNVHAYFEDDHRARLFYVALDERGRPLRYWDEIYLRWHYHQPVVGWHVKRQLSRAEEAYLLALPAKVIEQISSPTGS